MHHQERDKVKATLEAALAILPVTISLFFIDLSYFRPKELFGFVLICWMWFMLVKGPGDFPQGDLSFLFQVFVTFSVISAGFWLYTVVHMNDLALTGEWFGILLMCVMGMQQVGFRHLPAK